MKHHDTDEKGDRGVIVLEWEKGMAWCQEGRVDFRSSLLGSSGVTAG